MLTPNDLGNFLVVENCIKIKIDDLIRKIQKDLKITLLRSQLEATGINVDFTTSPSRFNGERVWFKCPYCKRRAGTLYKNPLNDNIGCRMCLNLKYRKQRFKGMIESGL